MIHEMEIIVRYAETDMMGVVHHAVYPVWAEAARTDLMNKMNYRYSEVEKSGIMLPVVDMSYRFKAPTYYEEKILIKTAVTDLNARQVRLDYEIWSEDKLCVIGFTRHIFMDSETRKSIRLSEGVLELFQQYYFPDFKKL